MERRRDKSSLRLSVSLSLCLSVSHSLLAYKQLFRVPEREWKDGARAVIANALIGRHGHMARDDGDDRRLFGEDSLNFAEGGCAALRVSLAGLLREQIVNPGFPVGCGLRLLRTPTAHRTALQATPVRGYRTDASFYANRGG